MTLAATLAPLSKARREKSALGTRAVVSSQQLMALSFWRAHCRNAAGISKGMRGSAKAANDNASAVLWSRLLGNQIRFCAKLAASRSEFRSAFKQSGEPHAGANYRIRFRGSDCISRRIDHGTGEHRECSDQADNGQSDRRRRVPDSDLCGARRGRL